MSDGRRTTSPPRCPFFFFLFSFFFRPTWVYCYTMIEFTGFFFFFFFLLSFESRKKKPGWSGDALLRALQSFFFCPRPGSSGRGSLFFLISILFVLARGLAACMTRARWSRRLCIGKSPTPLDQVDILCFFWNFPTCLMLTS